MCFHYTLILHHGFKWNSTGILWQRANAEKKGTELKVVGSGILYSSISAVAAAAAG